MRTVTFWGSGMVGPSVTCLLGDSEFDIGGFIQLPEPLYKPSAESAMISGGV